ncbi:hypothetical protein J6590_094717 [Homalodisca vitripennis]|nr:hypothetical protein J6590_094717 [Homalodisca vitripennis]
MARAIRKIEYDNLKVWYNTVQTKLYSVAAVRQVRVQTTFVIEYTSHVNKPADTSGFISPVVRSCNATSQLDSQVFNSKFVWDCSQVVYSLAIIKNVTVYRVPGHEGISGN